MTNQSKIALGIVGLLASWSIVYDASKTPEENGVLNGVTNTSVAATNSAPDPVPEGTIRIVAPPPARIGAPLAYVDVSITPSDAPFLAVKRGDTMVALMKNDADVIHTPLELAEGANQLDLYIQSTAGALSEPLAQLTIEKDTKPPVIYKYCNTTSGMPTFGGDTNSEWVCLQLGSFSGPQYGTAYGPVIGSAGDNIGAVFFANHRLTVGADGYINQNIAVPVSLGTNVYEIKVTDNLGNQAIGRYDLTWVKEDLADNEDTPSTSGCCKICTTGKACGDSCISRSYTCHKGPGCACDAY